MTSIVVLPNTEGLDAHAVLGLINDLAEQLGCARVPYLRNGGNPAVDLPALKELMDLALGLLDEEAEEDAEPFPTSGFMPYQGQGSWGSASGGGVYTPRAAASPPFKQSVASSIAANPSATGAAVGPGNTKLFHKIARYQGWSDDLVKDVDPLVIGQWGKTKVLEWIEKFIQVQGYNPGNFTITVGVTGTVNGTPSTIAVYDVVTGKSHVIQM